MESPPYPGFRWGRLSMLVSDEKYSLFGLQMCGGFPSRLRMGRAPYLGLRW
jgi:hypothetical protein